MGGAPQQMRRDDVGHAGNVAAEARVGRMEEAALTGPRRPLPGGGRPRELLSSAGGVEPSALALDRVYCNFRTIWPRNRAVDIASNLIE